MSRKGQGAEIDSLTGLRWLAATLVFLYHTYPHGPGHFAPRALSHLPELLCRVGWSGVTIFFTLSGFLLTLLYYPQFGRGLSVVSFKPYFLKRVARIYPLYWFVLLVAALNLAWGASRAGNCGILAALLDQAEGASSAAALRPGWRNLYAHLVLLHGYFSDFAVTYIAPGWSLTIEESFYLLLPLFIFLLALLARDDQGFGRPLRSVAALAALGGAIVTAGYLINRYLAYRPYGFFADWVNQTVFGQFPTFGLGILVALVFRRYRQGRLFTSPVWGNLFGCAGVALYVLGAWAFAGHDSWMEGFAGQAIFSGAAALFLLSLCGRSAFAAVFALPPLVYGGRISYAFYLIAGQAAFHKLLLGAGLTTIPQFYIGYLIFAALLYHVVEKPCHTWLRKRWAPPAAGQPVRPAAGPPRPGAAEATDALRV
jgi:peptidoglycan/LPS O-acetylase OafA/YrhL